jgi:glutamate-5-semialdehyde dehydrogenase
MNPVTKTELTTREKLQRAHEAAPRVGELSTEAKNALLERMAEAIEANADRILAGNREDLETSGFDGAIRDRLLLTRERIAGMARGVREVAALADPVGRELEAWDRPNGLRIRKVSVPLGVVGVIYEARPNVTADAIALALKSGNAVVLRGGKDAVRSNECIVAVLAGVAGVPEAAIELLDATTRDSVQELLQARGLVDVVIPRGGPGLIRHVVENATVPTIETGAGNCHIFVDEAADFDMADRILINAKTQRPSVCNAVEKLLVHRAVAESYVPRIVAKLMQHGVEVLGDAPVRELLNERPTQAKGGLEWGTTAETPTQANPKLGCGTVGEATEEDWHEEYARLCIAVRVVEDVEAAIAHINYYSTHHSDAIITEDEVRARRFLRAVDSAAVYWNASTRFSDGGEFGFGAEMGISTQKLHCRGPFALRELTSAKYEVIGTGQIRE